MRLGQIEDRICQPIYDTVSIHPGTNRLFVIPVGQGTTLFGHGAKHFGDTNMFLCGEMPAGWQFSVRSLYIEPIGDVWKESALAGTAIHLVIGAKMFLTIPYARARCSLVVTQEMMTTAFRIADELKRVAPAALPMLLGSMPGISFGFDLEGQDLVLRNGENFGVEVMAPATAPSDGAVRIYLNGIMGRPVY